MVCVGRHPVKAWSCTENVIALFRELVRLKPASAKGTYVKSITLSSTMGPGVRIDTLEATRAVEGL